MLRLVKSMIVLVSLLIAGQGCAHQPSLDPSPPAAASNYPTAEFWAQGQLFHGLGEISLKKGEPLSKIQLRVQGYFGGTIRVDSGFCHIKKSSNYDGMELVNFPLEGAAKESCLLDIVVSVIYPKGVDSTTLVYEMKGQLFLKVLTDDKPFMLSSSRIPDRSDSSLFVPVDGMGGAVQVIFKGCGFEYIDSVAVNDGEAIVSARSVSGGAPMEKCLHEGFISTLTGVKRVSWNIWYYAKGFAPLPLPKLQFAGEYLRVAGDFATAAIILDDNYKLVYAAVFKLDPTEDHILRLLTVKGRSVLCQWFPARMEWVCRQ